MTALVAALASMAVPPVPVMVPVLTMAAAGASHAGADNDAGLAVILPVLEILPVKFVAPATMPAPCEPVAKIVPLLVMPSGNS